MSEREEGYMMQHLCECFIDNNCEKLNVIWKGDPDLVPWPEIRVIMEAHGEQSVYDIRPVKLGPRDTPLREKERLVLKYGRDVVEAVYAGKSFNMEFFMPGWPVNPAKSANRKAQDHRPTKERFQKPDEEAIDARI
jgi:hypothetical protein